MFEVLAAGRVVVGQGSGDWIAVLKQRAELVLLLDLLEEDDDFEVAVKLRVGDDRWGEFVEMVEELLEGNVRMNVVEIIAFGGSDGSDGKMNEKAPEGFETTVTTSRTVAVDLFAVGGSLL